VKRTFKGNNFYLGPYLYINLVRHMLEGYRRDWVVMWTWTGQRRTQQAPLRCRPVWDWGLPAVVCPWWCSLVSSCLQWLECRQERWVPAGRVRDRGSHFAIDMKYQATAQSQMLSGCSILLSNYYLQFKLYALWGALPTSLIICNTKAVHWLLFCCQGQPVSESSD